MNFSETCLYSLSWRDSYNYFNIIGGGESIESAYRSLVANPINENFRLTFVSSGAEAYLPGTIRPFCIVLDSEKNNDDIARQKQS
jgi:hypothetical protein